MNPSEVRTHLNFLRSPHFESSFSTFCRRRNSPRFNTSGLRDTSTNRRSGKSHTAFGLRHVDISLRTIFLPVTFFPTQSTLGSRHEALFQRISFTFHGTLATTLAFSSLAFVTFSTLASFALALVGGALAVFFPCHGMTHQCFAQPTLLNSHRGQGLQLRARNHVLASLDSTCHEPPCTPRLASYKFLSALHSSSTYESRTSESNTSRWIQSDSPARKVSSSHRPSRHTLQLSIVAMWIRSSHCTRSHLQSGRFLLFRALARGCPCCHTWTGDDTTSDDGASLPHAPSEVLSTGPWMLWSLCVDPRPKVCHRT